MRKKVFVTGGHVTPAIAVIEQLPKDIDVVFIGRRQGTEETLIGRMGVRFLPITAGRYTFPSVLLFPIGFFQALWLVVKEKPSLIMSFGGYVALPVAIAAWIFRIPVITHEQTLTMGFANRIIATFAKKVCVSFPHKGFTYTGLPIRKELFTEGKPPFRVDEKLPILYITGGSLGAQSLNTLVYPIIAELTREYVVIHQIGQQTDGPEIKNNRYYRKAYFFGGEAAWVLHHATLIIGRSGANTVVELAAFGKVALFIPLPWSGSGEQGANAAWLRSHGGAEVISQDGLTSSVLFTKIQDMRKNHTSLQARASAFASQVPHDGASRVADEIEKLLEQI